MAESTQHSGGNNGTLEQGITGDYDFNIGDVLSEGWRLTDGAKGTLLAIVLITCVILGAVQWILDEAGMDAEHHLNEGRLFYWLILTVGSVLISTPFHAVLAVGVQMTGIARARGQSISVGDLFQATGLTIPLTILTLIASVVTGIGYLLLILPGIYLTLAYCMAGPLMVEHNLAPWEALEASRKAVTHHWFKIFFLGLILVVIVLLSAIPAFIGLIWTLPLATTTSGVLYRTMFGAREGH